MSSRSVVFRCDAGPMIGGGHAVRCLALAEILAERGWRILFALGSNSIATVPALAKYPHLFVAESVIDERAQIAAAAGSGVDWLVIDHYQRDIDFESASRGWAKRILVIDDLADRRHDADLLLDQTIGRTEHDYAALVPPYCRLLVGPKYALVRPQFASSRRLAEDRRRVARPAQRLLVSFGASDPQGLTTRLLAALIAHLAPLAIDVVSGTHPHHSLVALAAAHPRQITLHAVVDDMASLMFAADLAAGAGGVTSWERCVLGLPAVLVVTAPNQRLTVERLTAANAAIVLGDGVNIDPDRAAVTILRLAQDPQQLARMSTAAFGICDGEGAPRVAAHVASI